MKIKYSLKAALNSLVLKELNKINGFSEKGQGKRPYQQTSSHWDARAA